MALIVDATEDRIETADGSEDVRREPNPSRDRRRIDVSDLPADEIDAFVAANVDTEDVSLEHCGAQTYLVVDE